ncbi:MAG: HAD family hydrolase [Bacteroidetes bacterium]|nr:HAD family hydrolase [Bacteroidota bacterium]
MINQQQLKTNNLSNYKHIIFDWNGTLLNDLWLAVDVIDKMLQKRGLEGMTIERYCEVFDFPVKDYYRNIGFDFDKESFEIVGSEFIHEYDKRQYECKLQPGGVELIEKLHHENYHLSVLSAREQSMLEQNLRHYKIEKYFPVISGLKDHYAHGKLESGLLLIEEAHVPPSETLLIGDTLHDADVAGEMGIDCVLIASGHQAIHRLQKANIRIYKSINDLINENEII